MAPKGTSVAWDHFVDLGDYFAECKKCKVILNYKSTISNLTKHLKRKHPLVNLVRRNVSPNQDSTSRSNQSLPTTASAIVIYGDSPSTSTIPSNPVQTVQTTIRSMSSYVFKKNSIKADIDNHIMDLFIKDFQPFRIVEDVGFKALLCFAFPSYVIPTRKYFSNNLLPSRYESMRVSKMAEIKRDAKTICITTDIWTACTSDA